MTEYELSEILSALEHGGEELQEVALERLRAVGEQAVEPLAQTIMRYLRAHTPQYDKAYQEMPEASHQRGLLGSLAYLRLHCALQAALSTRTLPILVQEAQSHTDLPIPGKEHRKWH